MLVSIHQPHYLPWLPYLSKVLNSELFVVLDDVAFTRNGWQNRNRIKTAQGPHILTVPATQKLGDTIREVSVPDNGWRKKHWSTLSQAYTRAPHWGEYRQALEDFYSPPWPDLTGPVHDMLKWHFKALERPVPSILSSSLNVQSTSTRRLVEIVRAVGGTGYLSGSFALEVYLDPREFAAAGLDLWLFDWKCPEYSQLYPSQGFSPNLACVDALLCLGSAGCNEILQQGGSLRRYAG
jgi:hypothetical protein